MSPFSKVTPEQEFTGSLQPRQTLEKRAIIDETLDRIIDCGNMGPVHPYVIMRVYNNEYKVSETFAEDKSHFCVYMVSPFTRALSVDEARDFMAAYDMDLPKIGKGRLPRGVRPEDVHAFEELRAALADQMPNFSPQQIDEALSNTDRLQGCVDKSVDELKALPNHLNHEWRYNAYYSWRKVDLPHGYCIYMTYPLNRGLTLKEAIDFIAALNLDLGTSPRIKSLDQEYDPNGAKYPDKSSDDDSTPLIGDKKNPSIARCQKTAVRSSRG
ncbi:MAG: hypothetical protein WCE70_03770 [Rhodanobacteraceae bacterium]